MEGGWRAEQALPVARAFADWLRRRTGYRLVTHTVTDVRRASRRAIRGIRALAFHGSRPTGVVVRLTRLLWEPLGDVIASHASKCRILSHLCERLRRRPSVGQDDGNIDACVG
jgi:hypothetical protein